MRSYQEIEVERDRIFKELGKLVYNTMVLDKELKSNEMKASALRLELEQLWTEMYKPAAQDAHIDENSFPDKAP